MVLLRYSGGFKVLASRITSKGQVTIPKELREWLGVRPGDKVAFLAAADGTVEIHKVDEQRSLAACLREHIRKSASDADIEQAIKDGWSKRGSN